MTRAEIEKTARTARRSAANEATFLWVALAIFIMFALMGWGPVPLMNWVALNMDVFAFCIIAGVFIGGFLALVYFFWAKQKINAAEVQNNLNMKQDRDKRAQEIAGKIKKMKEKDA